MGLMQSINACAVPRTSQNVKLKGLVAGVVMQMFWTWGITDIYIFLGIIVFFLHPRYRLFVYSFVFIYVLGLKFRT